METPKPPREPKADPKPAALPLSELDRAMRGLVGTSKEEVAAQEKNNKRDAKRKRA